MGPYPRGFGPDLAFSKNVLLAKITFSLCAAFAPTKHALLRNCRTPICGALQATIRTDWLIYDYLACRQQRLCRRELSDLVPSELNNSLVARDLANWAIAPDFQARHQLFSTDSSLR